MDNDFDSIINALEDTKKIAKNGTEYWMGRNIQLILGYTEWRNFQNVIDKAQMACENSGKDAKNHFVDSNKKVLIGSNALAPKSDYFLTRYACYLIAMNGDSKKPEVSIAQSYFAYQTRKQELTEKLTDEERRIMLREKVKDQNKKLVGAAQKAGVKRYPVFQDAGYRGLYGGKGLSEIKKHKGLSSKDELLDRAGRTELAANLFRSTQTEDKLIKDNVDNEAKAINIHREVGEAVRNTIEKLGGTMPEDLLPEPSIKKLISRRNKEIKKLSN